MANEKGGQIFIEQKEEMRTVQENPNTQEEQDIVKDITRKANQMFSYHNQAWREFNDRTLFDYINDNEKRINNYVTPRDANMEDWQTKGFEGITREKMFAFVSAVAPKRPKYKFKATKKGGIIDNLSENQQFGHAMKGYGYEKLPSGKESLHIAIITGE